MARWVSRLESRNKEALHPKAHGTPTDSAGASRLFHVGSKVLIRSEEHQTTETGLGIYSNPAGQRVEVADLLLPRTGVMSRAYECRAKKEALRSFELASTIEGRF
jgi:hypothetical protein